MNLIVRLYLPLSLATLQRSLAREGEHYNRSRTDASDSRWHLNRDRTGGKGGRQFVSSANRELKVLAFDEDYDFNLPPPPELEGGPVQVNVSLNLRNVLQVCAQTICEDKDTAPNRVSL